MKVRMTIEFPDDYRRAIRVRTGERGLATRAECRRHVDMMLDADAQELVYEMDMDEDAKDARRGGG